MSGLLGTLSMDRLVKTAVQGSQESFTDSGVKLSRPMMDTLKQETIYHLLKLHVECMAGTSSTDKEIVENCLVVASNMLDRGDCTSGTFVRVQNELPKLVRSLRATDASANAGSSRSQAMQIIDQFIEARTTGYSPEESKMLADFMEQRKICEDMAKKLVDMVYGPVRRCVPDLLAKYPNLLPEDAKRPFVLK